MKTVKFIFLSLLVFCIPFVFTACDSETKPLEMELPEVSFEIPIFNLDLKSDVEDDNFRYFFGESKELSLNDPMFSALKPYKGKNISFLVKGVSIEIKAAEGKSGTSVKYFKSVTINSENEKEIDNYSAALISLDKKIENDPELISYINSIFSAIQNDESIVINAQGETDITPDAIEDIDLELGFIIITPKIVAQIDLTK